MKTMKKIQIAVTAVAFLVAVRLADNMEPTTNELMGSVALVISGSVSLWTMLLKSESQPEAE